jgi:hypothetical protein
MPFYVQNSQPPLFTPPPPPPQNPKTNPTRTSNPTMGQRHNLPLKRTSPPPSTKRAKNQPGSLRSFPFPCAQYQCRHTLCTQLTRVPASKPYGMNDGVMQTIFGLHDIVRGGSTHLRHCPHYPQRCVVPFQAKSAQPSRRTHVHGE